MNSRFSFKIRSICLTGFRTSTYDQCALFITELPVYTFSLKYFLKGNTLGMHEIICIVIRKLVIYKLNIKLDLKLKETLLGHLGGSVGLESNFGSGHDLAVREFEPCVGLCVTAQSLEPASDSVSPPLCPSHAHALSLSVSVSQ